LILLTKGDNFFYTDIDANLDAFLSSAPPIAEYVPNSQEVPINSNDEMVSIPATTYDQHDQNIDPTNENQEVVIKSTVN
jgi:hypothetical protein